ncbi:conserved hypothetical protein [Altererythrobacter sp. B11]|nr:conserved hypothetical protein [Altererythrobacter sp. B11]
MLGVGWATIAADAAVAWHGVTELLGRHLQVMRLAEVARIAVLVGPVVSQRDDVIDPRGLRGAAQLKAHLTQAIRAPKAALAIALACSTALARGSH